MGRNVPTAVDPYEASLLCVWPLPVDDTVSASARSSHISKEA